MGSILLLSRVSRSYKEAQLYFFPVFILGLVPALAAMLPIPLRSAVVVVPIANLSVAVKEVLIGTFDWPMIVLAWVVTAGAASWISRVGVRVLSSERLITVSETDAVQFMGARLCLSGMFCAGLPSSGLCFSWSATTPKRRSSRPVVD